MKIVAIIQARVGSTRLPGKVLEDLAGEPMLARVVNRVSRAQRLDVVVVATTSQPADDAINRLCGEQGWPVFRGSEDDVLDRYYRAAVAYQTDIVVRITSDCPLIEPQIIDTVVGEFLSRQPQIDYASNSLERTFPRGLDVEVMGMDALRRAWEEDKSPTTREHVTPHIQRHPDRFRIHSVTNDDDYSDMRWTVDTVEDLEFIRKVYDHFQNDMFTWKDVLEVLQAHPEWLNINRHVQQKAVQ